MAMLREAVMMAGVAIVDGPLERIRLVELAAHGDPAAFEAIVQRVGDGLYRRALAILRDEMDARDATQEALIRGWRELPRLGSAARFDAWLDRILVNVCRDQLRRRGRQQVREITLPDGREDQWPLETAPDSYAREDRSAAILAAFRRLSVDDRTLLVLHHLEKRPVSDLAIVLAVPAGTVMRRLFDARARLQRALEEESR
jgi:RNA polymerase sigma-70 factor (ECF subfamily)